MRQASQFISKKYELIMMVLEPIEISQLWTALITGVIGTAIASYLLIVHLYSRFFSKPRPKLTWITKIVDVKPPLSTDATTEADNSETLYKACAVIIVIRNDGIFSDSADNCKMFITIDNTDYSLTTIEPGTEHYLQSWGSYSGGTQFDPDQYNKMAYLTKTPQGSAIGKVGKGLPLRFLAFRTVEGLDIVRVDAANALITKRIGESFLITFTFEGEGSMGQAVIVKKFKVTFYDWDSLMFEPAWQ